MFLHFSCECLLPMLTEVYDRGTIVNSSQQQSLGQQAQQRYRKAGDICHFYIFTVLEQNIKMISRARRVAN